MKVTKEIENRFLILYSVKMQNGKATKNQVLDYLEENNLILLSENDRTILASRKEEKWRNELAFVRQHLVQEGFLSNKETNYWTLTESAEIYLSKLKNQLGDSSQRINRNLFQEYSNIEDAQLLNSHWATELFDDNKELKNEIVERKVLAIKRYKAIVTELKQIYGNKCQVENCQFSFMQINGEGYSEAHHLIPLSQGGSQNKENVVILCANHHRMFHYAQISIDELEGNSRSVIINNELKRLIYIL